MSNYNKKLEGKGRQSGSLVDRTSGEVTQRKNWKKPCLWLAAVGCQPFLFPIPYTLPFSTLRTWRASRDAPGTALSGPWNPDAL